MLKIEFNFVFSSPVEGCKIEWHCVLLSLSQVLEFVQNNRENVRLMLNVFIALNHVVIIYVPNSANGQDQMHDWMER